MTKEKINNLVKNNPTAKKAVELYKAKQKRNENIKWALSIWAIIFLMTLFGKTFNEPTVSANNNKNVIIAKITKSHIIKKDTTQLKQTSKRKVRKKIEPVHISEKGMRFIKETEQFSAQGYWDVNGVTLGWGHKINKSDPKWLQNKKVGDWISRKDADELFEKDMNEFINPSLVRITDELSANKIYISQDVIDGMASLIYNCGEYGFKTTKCYQLFKKGKINKAIACVANTKISCEGHKERRKNEQALMMGDYEI